MKRALRRHHLNRLKTKAKKIYPYIENAIKFANHLKMCSCWMCGNPRKINNELTLKEKQFLEGLKYNYE